MINAAIVLSDTHCGSSIGLAHPASEQEAGNVVSFGANYHQEWLWECWTRAVRICKEKLRGAHIALIANGDLTDGVHHKTAELIASSIDEHLEIATKCLRPFRDITSKLFVTRGTECHTLGIETKLAQDLDAEGGKAKDKWLIDIHGTMLDVAHHMSTATRVYLEASQLAANLQNARLNYLRTNQRVPTVFLRGHRHCGGVYSDGASMIAVTGGWQFGTRYAAKVVPDAIPRPSVVILDWRAKDKGELPAVEQIVFNPPPEEIAVV